MDASRYLKLKVQAQGQYIRKNTFMDAGLRTEFIAQQSGSLTPIAALPGNNCGNATDVRRGVSSCCAYAVDPMTVTGIQLPCCPFPYTSTSYLSPCKVDPHCATPAEQKAAWARMTNSYYENCSSSVRYLGPA